MTVLMPVYNAERYLREAIESMLAQTEPDFELLLIDDGSTDGSLAVACSYTDPRIRLVVGAGNRGLVARLNQGLDAATTRYVARMDADDIADPDRLRQQLAYMRAQPDIAVCGTWLTRFSPCGAQELSRFPTSHTEITARMLFECPLAHPTVMFDMRKMNEVQLRYRDEAAHAEDYDLWSRSCKLIKMGNLPQYLHKYRIHPASVGAVHGPKQSIVAQRARAQTLSALGVTYSERELAVHRVLSSAGELYDGATLAEVAAWTRKLKRHVGPWTSLGRAVRRECTERLGKITRTASRSRAAA